MEEGSVSNELKTWGFRRSTIARREFIEAVSTLDSGPSTPRRGARQCRGRGRGRGRGKQASETAAGSAAPKRGRGGRRRVPESTLTPAEEKSNDDQEREDAAQLKSGQRSVSEGILSDSAEDSDNLTLREIRKRAVSRRLEEHEDNDGVKHTEYTAEETGLVQQEDGNLLEGTDGSSKATTVLSSLARWASGNSVAVKRARETAKSAKKDCEFAGEEYKAEEESSEKIDRDVSCCTCQQTHSNRLMMCCASCREWSHCVDITEGNRETYICSTCSEGLNTTNTNTISTSPAEETVAETLEEQTVQEEMRLEEEVKDEMRLKKEKAAAPQCIGPGCRNYALPESVYCGHLCIVQHAAVTIKCLSEPKAAVPPEPLLKSQKRSFLAKLFKVKVSESPGREESVSREEVNEGSVTDSERPSAAAHNDKPTIKDKDEVEGSTDTKTEASDVTLDNPSSEKTPVLPPIKKSTPGRARKTMSGSPRLEILRGALSKSQGGSKSTSESSKAPDVNPAPYVNPAPDDRTVAPPSSPLQIRQNFRRSLTEVLLQSINDIDHLDSTGHEVEKLAVNMEKEVFNMCYTTDEVYQNKYRRLLLNLKDPKNKALCHQLLKGEISPIKLLNLSEQDIQSVEDTTGDPVHQTPSSPPSLQVEDHPSVSQEKLVDVRSTNTLSVATHSEEKSSLSQLKQTQVRKFSSDVPDVISMLKDTTLEHRRHLFDLNCRICTGQVSTDGDPETKKLKMEMTRENIEEEKSWLGHVMDEVPPPANTEQDSSIIESPASPNAEECEMKTLPVDFSPVLIPSVPTVSISRRDPRTAQFRQVLTPCTDPKFVSPQSQPHNVRETLKEMKVVQPPHVPVPIPPSMPKSILMKPSPSSASRLDASYGSNTRLMECHTPSDKGTRQLLSKQDTLWKGFLNMPTVAKFVTKGYLISGTSDYLKEDLPDTIHIGGRILPQTVWEYVELIKTSEAKEMALIRFHPSSEEEEVAYVSLFSYFNSRRRFGVVSNICKHIKDLYLIPLCAKQPIPAVLLPVEGPGLEQNHPNLLIGLVVCQKPKRPEALPQEAEEKKSSLLIHSDSKAAANNPTSIKTLEDYVEHHNTKTCDPDILVKTDPLPSFGLPLSGPSPLSSASSVSKLLTFDEADSSSSSTPLQTILNTLFGQRKQNPDVTECETSSSTDKVQQLQQTCKEAVNSMELGDDRPYDPEEYDPAMTYRAVVPSNPTTVLELNSPTMEADDDDRPYDPEEEYNAVDKVAAAKNSVPKTSEHQNTQEISTVNDDLAYDPEDETVFEEMQNYITNNGINHRFTICEQDNISGATLSEQQKILEELNRQIEEQKRQLEEQTETLRLQKEAIGVSMAHFSVSHALMSPPPQFGRDEEKDEDEKLSYPTIYPIRDPRTCRKTSKDAEDASEAVNKENTTQILINMKDTTAVLDTSSISNKEKLEDDKTVPKEGSPDTETVQLQSTTSSHSEYSSKTKDSRRSTPTSTYKSSRRRTWHEHRSYHQDRASSRASHKTRVPKNVSDKHHSSRQSAKHLSRRHHSDRKRTTSSRKSSHHHHRDSPSSSGYRSRRDCSTGSRSSWRDRPPKDDSDQQQPRPSVPSAQSSQPDSEQGPGSKEMPCETAHHRDKQLAELQQGDYSTTKPLADKSSQRPHTSQNPGEDSRNNNRSYRNQPFSGHSEIKKNTLPLSKMDHSSKKRPLLPSPYMHSLNTANSDTDQPLNNTTPALQPPQIQIDVFHHDSVGQYIEKGASSNQPPQNQTVCFSGSSHMVQERGLTSMQRQNSLQNEADNISSSGDFPQRAFQSQYRDFPQFSTNQLNCRDISLQELPQKKRREFLEHEADCSNQLTTSHKQEAFTTDDLGQFDKQMRSNHIPRRKFQSDTTDQVRQGSQQPRPPQVRGCSAQEPEIIHFHHEKGRPHMKGQSVHRDESAQFQQRESILGPPPVEKGNFRPLNPKEHFRPEAPNPSCFDKCKPPRETLSMMEIRKSAQPRNAHTNGPGGPSPGPSRFQHGMDSPSVSCQIMHDRTHGALNSMEPMGLNAGRPSEGQFDKNRDSQRSHCNSPKGHAPHRQFDNTESHLPHPNTTRGFAPFEQFHEGQSDYRGFSHQQPNESRGHAPPQPRGLHRSGFRGRGGRNGGTCFGRGHEMNAQMRGPRFDSPQQVMDQRKPSPDFNGQRKPLMRDNFEDHNEPQSSGFPDHSITQFKNPECQNTHEIQNLWQPRTRLECPPRQPNIRPLRLSGPLLPTPVGCGIRPNIPRLQRPNSHSDCSRSQGQSATDDIRGPWVHRERRSTGHNFHPQQSDDTESFFQEEQRDMFEGRRGEESVQDSYGHPYRGTRGRHSSRRAGRRQRFRDNVRNKREYAK